MSWVFLFLIACLAYSLIKTAMEHRQHAQLTDRKFCKHCTAVYPSQARFCGRCGRSFS